MNDLSDYFSDKDEIKRLNKQVDMIAGFYKSYHEDRIKELESKLINSRRTASRYKRLYEDLKGEEVKPRGYRGERAEQLIKELKGTDRPINLIRSIAKKCFLSEATVERFWYPR